MGISENIKLLREQYGLSQKELGQIAGVSDKAVSTWEQGIKEPRMGAIQKIADHFGIQKRTHAKICQCPYYISSKSHIHMV